MDAVIVWFFIGTGFILFELFTPVFILVFFGIGAWAAALMSLIFPGIEGEIITFILVSLLSLIVLRKKMLEVFQGKQSKNNPNPPHYIGRQAEVVKDISPTHEGEISLGGSWRATAKTLIATGSTVIVLSSAENDELLLLVELVDPV